MNADDAVNITQNSYDKICIEKQISIIDKMIENEAKQCKDYLVIHKCFNLFTLCQISKIEEHYKCLGFDVDIYSGLLYISWFAAKLRKSIKESNNV